MRKFSPDFLTHLERYKNLIFDWNGTILDDVDISVDSINEILSSYDLSSVSREEYREKFCFPVINYYRSVGFDLKTVSFEDLSVKFVAKYFEKIKKATIFDGMDRLLESLAKTKKIYLLSAAMQSHLDDLTSYFQVNKYFIRAMGVSDFYAKGKLDQAQRLLKEEDISVKETLLIGDTDHDYEVGAKLGVDVLLIADGHQSQKRLAKVCDLVLQTKYNR